jgi:hypothetical protein
MQSTYSLQGPGVSHVVFQAVLTLKGIINCIAMPADVALMQLDHQKLESPTMVFLLSLNCFACPDLFISHHAMAFCFLPVALGDI